MPYEPGELDLLVVINRAATEVMAKGESRGVFSFSPRLGENAPPNVLTDLAAEHPDLLRFSEETGELVPLWMQQGANANTGRLPKILVRALPKKSPLPGWLKMNFDEKVSALHKKYPVHSLEMTRRIVQRIELTGEPYGVAWIRVYLLWLGLWRHAFGQINDLKPATILLDAKVQKALRILIRLKVSLAMALPLVLDADPMHKAQTMEYLLREPGVDIHTARQIVLLEGDRHYQPEELSLLKDLTLHVQENASETMAHIDRVVESENASKQILSILANLAATHPQLLNFDAQEKWVIPYWIRGKKGRLRQQPLSISLRYRNEPPASLGFPMTKDQIKALESATENKDYRAALRRMTSSQRVGAIRREGKKKTVFFMDDTGKVLAKHEGLFDTRFNMVLEYLLRKHANVWVEGLTLDKNQNLPARVFHLKNEKLLQGSPLPSGHVAIRFARGFRGKAVITHSLSLNDFENIVTGTEPQKALDNRVETLPAEQYVKHAPVSIQTEIGEEHIDVQSPEMMSSSSLVWEWFALSGGIPIIIKGRKIPQSGRLKVLFSHTAELRGLAAGAPFQWTLLPKKDGVEIRITYLDENPKVNVFVIPLPKSILAHPYFAKQTEVLTKNRSQLRGGIFHEATPGELDFVRQSMEKAKFIEKGEWDRTPAKPAEELENLRQQYGGSLELAARAKRMILFYDFNGEPFDFAKGSYLSKNFKKKLAAALESREEFWVAGVRLDHKCSISSFPLMPPSANIFSYVKRGFRPGEKVALHIGRGPGNAPLNLGVARFTGLEKTLREGASVKQILRAKSVRAYLVMNDGSHILLDAHPARIRASVLRERLSNIPPSNVRPAHILLTGVRAAKKGNPTRYILGVDSHAFPSRLGGKRLDLEVDLENFRLMPRPEWQVASAGFRTPASDREEKSKASGIAIRPLGPTEDLNATSNVEELVGSSA